MAGIEDGQFHISKLSRIDGELLWQRQHAATNRVDMIRGAAVDDSGNLFVTGWGIDSAGKGQMCTAKFAATDGTAEWVTWHRWSGAESAHIEGRQIICLDDGDVIATGVETVAGVGDLAYLAKYRGLDGGFVWEKRFSSDVASHGAYPIALFRDAPGGLVLGIFGRNSKVFGIRSSTGAERWQIAQTGFYAENIALRRDRLAIAGYGNGLAQTIYYVRGPELSTRLMGDEVEVGWEVEHLGSTLERLSGGLEAGQWLGVEGSTETNLVRVPRRDGMGFFRLMR